MAVQLPPMARALQEFVDALPHGPLPQGMPGPSPDDMINLLNHMMIPPQFYTPPATMRVGTGANKSSSGPSSGNGRHGGRQGGKRGKRDDDDSPVPSTPDFISPCLVCCPCAVGLCVLWGGACGWLCSVDRATCSGSGRNSVLPTLPTSLLDLQGQPNAAYSVVHSRDIALREYDWLVLQLALNALHVCKP